MMELTKCWSLHFQPVRATALTGHLWYQDILFTVTRIPIARYVLTISPRLQSASTLMLRCKKCSRYNGKGTRNWLEQLQLPCKSTGPQGVPENLWKQWWPQARAQHKTGHNTRVHLLCFRPVPSLWGKKNRKRAPGACQLAGTHGVYRLFMFQAGTGVCVWARAHWCPYTQGMCVCRLTQGERSRMDKEQPCAHQARANTGILADLWKSAQCNECVPLLWFRWQFRKRCLPTPVSCQELHKLN